MDRFPSSELERFAAVRTGRFGAVKLLLRADLRERTEPAAASPARRALHTLAVLRQPPPAGGAQAGRRLRHQPQTDSTVDARARPGSHLPQAAPEPAGARPRDPSICAARCCDQLGQPRLEQRYYDITYVRLQDGFAYLAAVIDWFSRFVLSWAVSNTVDAWLCREVLDAALATNAQPEIFNTDQGSQFTSQLFLAPLKERNIRISMDGRGRALDNAFIERLWRTVKYEYIYLHEHTSLAELRDGLRRFFYEYNFLRPHQALQYRTPAEVFFGTRNKKGR